MGKNAHEPNSLSSLPGNPAAAPADGQARGPKGFRLKPGQVLCGDLDMRIDRNGVWYHHGSPIGRKELVRLFSTVLRRDEAGDCWLITPAEVGRIEVEDAPFMAVELTTSGAGAEQIISLRTNVDKIVTVDGDHPIRCDIDPETGEPSPYLVMDGGVEARIARAVYYELVALGVEEKHNGEPSFGVRSSGAFFPLGKLDGGP
jgi:hypothetical protein